MNDNNNDVITIDLFELGEALLKKLWLIILVMVITGGIGFGLSRYVVQPMYKSSALFYVNNRTGSLKNDVLNITNADLTSSRNLVDTYIVILKSRNTLNDVIDAGDFNMSYEKLAGMISATAENNTEVFRVTVTNTDPVLAEKIANTIAEVLPDKISGIVEGSSVKIVDYAIIPGQKSSPSVKKWTLVGALIGMILICLIIMLTVLLDYEIHDEEYLIREYPEVPLLAAIPDFFQKRRAGKSSKYNQEKYANSKKGKVSKYYKYGTDEYKYGKEYLYAKDSDNKVVDKNSKFGDIGPKLSFAAREAYKLLRTNLDFALTDVEGCKVIGISSSLRGEGKSTTSINLSYTLAQAGKKVLLVEGDMRIPTLAEKLSITVDKGLSDAMVGDGDEGVLNVRRLKFKSGAVDGGFDLLTAGSIPPNPSEILGSEKMRKFIELFKNNYDYILMDLPPVIAVTDALVASKLTNGMVIMVRQDHTEKGALEEVMRQMHFANAKILGFVYSWAKDNPQGYSKKYRNRYHRGYKNYSSYGYKGYGDYYRRRERGYYRRDEDEYYLRNISDMQENAEEPSEEMSKSDNTDQQA